MVVVLIKVEVVVIQPNYKNYNNRTGSAEYAHSREYKRSLEQVCVGLHNNYLPDVCVRATLECAEYYATHTTITHQAAKQHDQKRLFDDDERLFVLLYGVSRQARRWIYSTSHATNDDLMFIL